MTLKGKCSTFGGPKDHGVGPHEDLALYERGDVATAPKGLFLPYQPDNTTGTARRLNPNASYCAMRWAYEQAECGLDLDGLGHRLEVPTTRAWLKRATIAVQANGMTAFVHAVDWGPNERESGGRIIDLSPGAASYLGVSTDDEVTVMFLPP